MTLSSTVCTIGYVFSVLSLICALYVIVSYFLSKLTRHSSFFFLIVCINFLDLCLNISSVPLLSVYVSGRTEDIKDGLGCYIFGVLRTFSLLSSYLMNVLLAWAIYCGVTMTSASEAKPSSQYYIHILGISIYSLIASLLPLSTNSIGKGTLYCDLRANDNTADLLWQFIDYIIPMVISFCCILTIMIKAIRQLRKLYTVSAPRRRFYRLLLFPAIFLFVNSGGFSSRIIVVFGEIPGWLEAYHFLLRQIQGVFHGGTYGLIFLLDRSHTSSPIDKSNSSGDSGDVLLANDSESIISIRFGQESVFKAESFY